MSNNRLTCPNCGNIDQSKIIGNEVRGVYDGVLFWSCRNCNRAFPRNWSGLPRRQEQCQEYVDRFNRAAVAGEQAAAAG